MKFQVRDPATGGWDFTVDKPNAQAAARYWVECQRTWQACSQQQAEHMLRLTNLDTGVDYLVPVRRML